MGAMEHSQHSLLTSNLVLYMERSAACKRDGQPLLHALPLSHPSLHTSMAHLVDSSPTNFGGGSVARMLVIAGSLPIWQAATSRRATKNP